MYRTELIFASPTSLSRPVRSGVFSLLLKRMFRMTRLLTFRSCLCTSWCGRPLSHHLALKQVQRTRQHLQNMVEHTQKQLVQVTHQLHGDHVRGAVLTVLRQWTGEAEAALEEIERTDAVRARMIKARRKMDALSDQVASDQMANKETAPTVLKQLSESKFALSRSSIIVDGRLQVSIGAAGTELHGIG